ncbi:mannosyltransferase [Micromonospora pallida]|uniref:Mannosyltransferase n=2 Tax=Micromonospora pallida TaxID=145854 RepID=A0A1C6T2L8_9ACTN|nr:mannosyltransferase [Micromonospora pallida]
MMIPRVRAAETPTEIRTTDGWDQGTTAPDADDPGNRAGHSLGLLAWIVPTLLMAILGLARATWPALWGDELATWGMARASWGDLWAVVQNFDAAIAPYYAFMHVVTGLLGESELALRLPSMLAMAGAAGLVGALGTRLASPRVGLTAGLIFAVLPNTSRYAQEARPYAIALFAAVLATWLLVRAIDRPGAPRWVAYAGAVALLGLSQFVALLLLAAHALVVLLMRPRAWWAWLIAAVVGTLPVLPVVNLARSQQVQVSWIPEATLQRMADLPGGLTGNALLGGALLALALVGMSLRRPAVVYTAWAFVPVLGLYVVSQVTPLWLPRYLLFVLPAFALLAATALSRAPVLRGLAVVVVVALAGLPGQLNVRETDGHTQASRDLGVLLVKEGRPEDVAVYGGNVGGDQRIARDAVTRYTPAANRPKDVLLAQAPRTGGSFTAQECAEVPTCLGTPQRVWVIRTGRLTDPLRGLGDAKESPLRSQYDVERVFRPTGYTVALLLRRQAAVEQPKVR